MNPMFKKTNYIKLNLPQNKNREEEPNVPSGSWVKCQGCGEVIYKDDLIENNYVCPRCRYYFRLSAPDRLAIILDKDSYMDLFNDFEFVNPLDFDGYQEKINVLKAKTNIDEAVLTGTGNIGNKKVAIGVMDSRFLMGSMGHIVGEKMTCLIEKATLEKLPLIIFTASGGARMQEGVISLMQMAKTSAAIKKHHDSGGLYITVLTDPTTGGVTASFAMLGDIILAEPNALIGFAGPRVIRDTIRQELPEGFQSSEFLMQHGFIDAIIERKKIRQTLEKLLEMHGVDEIHTDFSEEVNTDLEGINGE